MASNADLFGGLFETPAPPTFEGLFGPQALRELFFQRFSHSPSRGIDRRNGYQIAPVIDAEVEALSRKCLDATFKFSAYLEQLQSKGRHKFPRVISIPVIRDRLVLHQVKVLVASAFSDLVPKRLANTFVSNVVEQLGKLDPTKALVYGCDVKDFYGSIRWNHLRKALYSRIADERLRHLIEGAIATPTVPRLSRRKDYAKYVPVRGIPQGLAISNILAAIYLSDVDSGMRSLGVEYLRYVDDILIFGDQDTVEPARRSLVARLAVRGLGVHPIGSGKSHLSRPTEEFAYLGYRFRLPLVTVRQASLERFLQSVAAKFSDYLHNKKIRLERYKFLNEDRYKAIFVEELNERITGAISEKRRYGWIAYFSQINDQTLLFKVDRVVAGMFERLDDFGGKPPKELKKISRAFFEMKFRPTAGYIHNYDKLTTPQSKIQFLLKRGQIDPEEVLSKEAIDRRYESYRRYALGQLELDESIIY